MTKQNKWFKVVRVESDKYYSYNAAPGSETSIEYKVNDWAYPKIPGSKLFIFKTYEDAFNFKNKAPENIILECEVINPTLIKYKEIPMNDEFIIKWWKQKSKKKKPYGYWNTPKGSYWCDAIKLCVPQEKKRK